MQQQHNKTSRLHGNYSTKRTISGGKCVRESNGGERAALAINKLVLFSADFLVIVCLIHLTLARFLLNGFFFTVSGLPGVLKEL